MTNDGVAAVSRAAQRVLPIVAALLTLTAATGAALAALLAAIGAPHLSPTRWLPLA